MYQYIKICIRKPSECSSTGKYLNSIKYYTAIKTSKLDLYLLTWKYAHGTLTFKNNLQDTMYFEKYNSIKTLHVLTYLYEHVERHPRL